jgi:hypothetical protein
MHFISSLMLRQWYTDFACWALINFYVVFTVHFDITLSDIKMHGEHNAKLILIVLYNRCSNASSSLYYTLQRIHTVRCVICSMLKGFFSLRVYHTGSQDLFQALPQPVNHTKATYIHTHTYTHRPIYIYRERERHTQHTHI